MGMLLLGKLWFTPIENSNPGRSYELQVTRKIYLQFLWYNRIKNIQEWTFSHVKRFMYVVSEDMNTASVRQEDVEGQMWLFQADWL